jgi:hypothetical protein
MTQDIRRGSRVEITSGGRVYRGVVSSVEAIRQRSDQPTEYGIELQEDEWGYLYWKQWTDGGEVRVLDGPKAQVDGSEYEVNYGNGWEPVDAARVRRVLVGYYEDVSAALEAMKESPGSITLNTIGAIYRIRQ